MRILLNPRFWIAAVIAAFLCFTHFTAYRAGKNNVRIEWESAKSAANSEARKLEALRQSRVNDSVRSDAARQMALRRDAAGARAAADGLRDDLRAVRLHAEKSANAASKSSAALSDVFERCSRRHSELAETADGHASDSLKYQEAWPR